MKRLFAVLIALALTVGLAISAGAQAGTANGQAGENFDWSTTAGKSISDSLTWSQSTTTAGRHTKTDTLVGTEADTSITVLNIANAKKIAAQLIYTNKLNGVTTTAFACSLHTQVSLDGSNWFQVPLASVVVTATSSTTNQIGWGFVFSEGDSLVTAGGGANRYIGGAKYLRFRTGQVFGNDTTFIKTVYHVVYNQPPR